MVGKVTVFKFRALSVLMFLAVPLAKDMRDFDLFRVQIVRYHGPMTSPMQRLSAHDSHRVLVRKHHELLNAFHETVSFHVVCVVSE